MRTLFSDLGPVVAAVGAVAGLLLMFGYWWLIVHLPDLWGWAAAAAFWIVFVVLVYMQRHQPPADGRRRDAEWYRMRD
jgi:hypothetical protein